MYHCCTLIFLSMILLGCTSRHEQSAKRSTGLENTIEFNLSSAFKVLDMARDIETGNNLDESAWLELFKSPGYKNYLVYRDSLWKMDLIKEAMYTVFDASNAGTLDSLLSEEITLDRNYMKLALVQNFNSIKANMEEIERFLRVTDFKDILSQADQLAQSYLPKAARDAVVDLYPVFVVVSDPDGKVQKEAIILDLNLMFEFGTEGLVKFIAHEFHHNYRQQVAKKFNNSVLVEINRIHQEGIADLIDKKQPPIEKLGIFPPSIIEEYNADYQNTPNRLRTFDSLVVAYSKGDIEETEFNSRIKGYFKFGGHTTGIYMSFFINRTIGNEQLIESYADPFTFLALYNRVAQEQTGEYVLSDAFMSYIEKLIDIDTNDGLHRQ